MARRHVYGHVRALQRTGNHRALREVSGHPLIFLGLYRAVLSKATGAEMIAALYQYHLLNYNTVRFYSQSQINRAEIQLIITSKRGSTTANEAMTPFNIQWRHNYWNMNYPFGMANI